MTSSAADATTRPATAGPQAPRPGAEADARRPPQGGDIAAEDWDLLCRAALELLERVAVERPTPVDAGLQPPPGTVLRECLSALEQLRRAAPQLWRQRSAET